MLPALTTAGNRIHLGHLNRNNGNGSNNSTNSPHNHNQGTHNHHNHHNTHNPHRSPHNHHNNNSSPPHSTPPHLLQHLSASKRATGMIFRIEHLLPPIVEPMAPNEMDSASLTAHASSAESPAKRPKAGASSPSGVYAAQFLPKNSLSNPMPTVALMAAPAAGAERSLCQLTPQGLHMSPPLVRQLKLSEDVHSYNALFELHAGPTVRVRIVRDIAADDEIVAWFGEQVSILMAIPFLTPLNIQGNKRYTCHLCHLTFETPNPLKVHLALGCGRHSMDILWVRLHYAAKAEAYPRGLQQLPGLGTPPPPPSQPPQSLSPHRQTPPQPCSSSTAHHGQRSPKGSPQPGHTTTTARLSAFKPISPSSSSASGMAASAPAQGRPSATAAGLSFSHSPHVNAFLPSLSSALQLPAAMNILQPAGGNPLNAAAQIEAIVSNMGASKQGHLCIYCGKVYSRKYGLKIHIRTHTGFKPLKCKFCLRPFGDPSNLNKHVRLHLQSGGAGGAAAAAGSSHNHGTSPTAQDNGYRCHLCHKTLARRRDLQRHMETRHSALQSGDKSP